MKRKIVHFLGTSEKATEKDLQRLSKLYLK